MKFTKNQIIGAMALITQSQDAIHKAHYALRQLILQAELGQVMDDHSLSRLAVADIMGIPIQRKGTQRRCATMDAYLVPVSAKISRQIPEGFIGDLLVALQKNPPAR